MKQIVAVALVAALSTSLSATPPQTQGSTAGSGTRKSTTARKRPSTATNNALTMQEAQKAINESPTTIRYKGITLTPGGFLAAETVWRQHGQTSEINTPFNAIPLLGNGQYHQSEFFGSGRPTRFTLLGEGSLANVKFTGYYEGDFNSAGITSNNNQSNSYTFRHRQVWGQAALTSGWRFPGGPMWSLVTEPRTGLDHR